MTLIRATSAGILALLVGTGAAWAQTTEKEPLMRNQTEGQLLPGQAEEVAPAEQNLNMETTPDAPPAPPATTGTLPAPAAPPAAAVDKDDDVHDDKRSISGKVHEQNEPYSKY